MKKNTFINGAIIATLAIFISKFLGLVYVIPFNSIVGEQAGALYGYAYTIYNLFLAISTIGLPPAMSKLISEYNALEFYYTKERAYKYGKNIVTILGILTFIILFVFAPSIAHAIIGDNTGGNTIEDITLVVRVISTAILIVPILSISKGYLQGHKFIAPSSYSQIVEQIVRVIVIIVGSYTVLNVLKLDNTLAVAIAVFGATVGALAALIYILRKINKNKKEFNLDAKVKDAEKNITSREIIKKILLYSFPFILFGITMSIFEFVDMLTIVKTLTNELGYSMKTSENIIGILNTWGNKLNSIVIAISSGVATSIVPNITSSYVKKDYKDVRHKINQAIQVILFTALPITIGLSFLAEPAYTLFYGASKLGPVIFKVSIFIALFNCIFNVCVVTSQSLNRFKQVFISLLSGCIVKIILQIPLMVLFDKFGMNASYGTVIASLLGYSASAIINVIGLYKHIKVSYKSTFDMILKTLLSIIIMLIPLILLTNIIDIHNLTRMKAIIVCAVYGIIGMIIYFIMTYKLGVIKQVLGDNMFNKIEKIINKIFRKKLAQ